MERCPNCRARCEGEDSCRRCGMDLTSLLAVEQAVDGLIVRALGQLAQGAVPAAIQTLTRASALQSAPFVGQLLGFARTLEQSQASPGAPPAIHPPEGDLP